MEYSDELLNEVCKDLGINVMPIYQDELIEIVEQIVERCKSEYNKIFRFKFRNYDGLVDTYYVQAKNYLEAQDTLLEDNPLLDFNTYESCDEIELLEDCPQIIEKIYGHK